MKKPKPTTKRDLMLRIGELFQLLRKLEARQNEADAAYATNLEALKRDTLSFLSAPDGYFALQIRAMNERVAAALARHEAVPSGEAERLLALANALVAAQKG